MIKLKIGDVVEVIRRNYPHYAEFGRVIDFHNGNAIVYFEEKPFEGNKFMCQPEDTKEYPLDSLKVVPSSWINRDYSSYFDFKPARTGIDEMAINMKKYLDIAQKEYLSSPTFDKLEDIPQFRTSNLIKRVVFSDRKTIILWNDGSKTMVSCAEGEQLDPYMGFCAAFTKGFFESKHQVEKMVKNADYQPSKKTKKKISEVLKNLREYDAYAKLVYNKKEASEILKKLREDNTNNEETDTKNEEVPETLKKKLIIANEAATLAEYLGKSEADRLKCMTNIIGKKVRYINPYSVFDNCIGTITRKNEFGNYIVTIEIDDGTVELPFHSYVFTFVDNE